MGFVEMLMSASNCNQLLILLRGGNVTNTRR
jgi:hypothetical protein